MFPFNLSSKVAVLVAALLIGLGAVMLVTFGILSARQIDRTIKSDAITAGKQLSLYLEERTADLRRQTHFAAEEVPRIKALIMLGDKATLGAEIPGLAKRFPGDEIRVVGAEGDVIGQSSGLNDLGVYPTKQDLSSLKPGEDRTSILAAGSEIYVVCCVPVWSGAYQRGAITLCEPLGTSQAKTLAAKLGDELGLVVGGRLVASSLEIPFAVPPETGSPTDLVLNDEPFVSIMRPLPGADPATPIGFVVLRPTSAITAPYTEARRAFVGVLGLSLLVSIGLGIAIGKGLAKPISSLADAARVVQAGQWPDTFDVQRQDEIGVLQTAFNDMIVASKESQERLMAMIDLDPLTELRNHRSFRERLSEEARRSEAGGGGIAFALIDIDRFDDLNESEGRSRGDQTIKQIADVIRECVPEFNVIARYAGDQFAVLMPNTDAESISVIMNYLRVRLRQSGCIATISVGCSEFPKNSSREDGLILAGELALSRAKQLGKDRVCLFDAVPGANQSADPFLLYQTSENGSFATIQALAAAVDAKDTYTNGHSERVATYAMKLATALGDSSETVEQIFRCGTLHDVGKIGVPDSVLKKPGLLEPDEMRTMETHAVLGELIVGKVPQLVDLLPGVRSHHERWDGKGYPDGLAGERIPYVARVLSIADSYDAMTSDRTYRKGMPHESALEEIKRSAGSQFDPRLVDAFVGMFANRKVVGV